MGISISGSNAISGLGGNDTDFDKVLTQLKKIESTQLNRLEAWKSDWNLRYDAFTQIIDQIQAASGVLANLSDKNNFVTKLVQSSNDNIITAVANASAQDVQHTIHVSQVASNSIWANTGKVFSSKTDIINTTGQDQNFSFTYAGKRHDIKIPPNTTLDSFASLVNNNSNNPGVKVSLIQTGNGYVFQVAGKDTGVENSLIIHASKLVGMDAASSTSSWQSNNGLNPATSVTNPTSYTFDLVLQGGAKKSVTIKGDASADELVTALNNAAGGIRASVDEFGNLSIDGVKSFSRRESSEKEYKAASLRVDVGADMKDRDGKYIKLNAAGGIAEGLGDDEVIRFTMRMDDGSTREFEIKAGATKRDLLAQMGQSTQGGKEMSIGLGSGGWGADFAQVTGFSFEAIGAGGVPDPGKTAALHPERLTSKLTEASGARDTLGGKITSETTLNFAKDKLDKRIDGKESGDAQEMIFTVIGDDGTAHYIKGLKSDMTNQEMLDKIKAELGGIGGINLLEEADANGNSLLKLEGVKDFWLSSGAVTPTGYSSSLKASASVSASNPNPDPEGTGTSHGNLFFTDPDGKFLLEEAPKLKYTVITNDGSKGTLELDSGKSMKEVLLAMQNPASWAWTDAESNPLGSAPASFAASFTDAEGNSVDPASFTGQIYLNFKDVQDLQGPGEMAGQVVTSSNWNIQRAANARYRVDNWPVEMEAASNSITDVIEGVVFNIQDVGDARISVSTDITSVEKSIQDFLDSVNSVLLTVNDLMKYDENKQITSNDPEDIGSGNYSPSGLTNQKGGLLMGNYGVQLFKSRFSSVVTGTPPGFKSRQSASDFLSGDVLASLANMGIKTDTDQNSDTYGLLVRAPASSIGELQAMDKENYNQMITNNLEAVVDFFCASGKGASSSSDFRYGSHVQGITKGGSYEVRYSVDDSGNILSVTVGGVEAKRDESMPGNYYSVGSGDGRGLAILIDDLSAGDHPPAGAEPMYVRIKEGLVQTVQGFLKDELVFNDVNISSTGDQTQIDAALALKSKNGALMSLRDNYKKVMENIDVKIEREQRRLSTWETRQKAVFANLETLLKKYGDQQTSLEAQLKQLSGNS